MDRRIISITETRTGDTAEPVSLSDAKDWCIVGHDSDNSLLTSLIKSIRVAIEKYTKCHLVPCTITAIIRIDRRSPYGFVLPRYPVSSLTSVEFKTDDTTFTELVENEDYTYSAGVIDLFSTGTFRLIYDVGFSGDAPEDILLAFKEELLNRYANRGDIKTESGFCALAESILENNTQMSWL